MIKTTIIFGKFAVREYFENNKVPSQEWLKDDDGEVDEREFKTLEEYNAYSQGLSDANGWEDTALIGPEFIEEKETDCKYCQEWRGHFSDRESDVYCPDCGKLIIHIKMDNSEENG